MHFPFWIGSQGANSCIPKVLKYVQRSHLGYWIKEINNGYSGSIRKDLAQACRSGWLPQIRAGSLQKGYPLHQSYKKIKKGLPMKTVASFQILVYPENFTVHAFWVPQKKQELPKEAILDKNSNRESHEQMFRFYWYRFGIGLPNVNGRPQICLEGLPVTCTNKKIKKACPFETDRLV